MTKYCITCKTEGHTYLECERVPFGDLVAGAFGVQAIGGKSPAELAYELEKIAEDTALEGLEQ